mgnify:FL=1
MTKKIILGIIIIGVILVLTYNYFEKENPNNIQNINQLATTNMKITIDSFKNGENIPLKYSCDGDNINPEIKITEIPQEAQSLVLIMDDPDAPMGVFTHWVIFNIPASSTIIINENSIPQNSVLGLNSANKTSYVGPCPPAGTHRYYFKVFALDSLLNLKDGAKREEIEKEMANHIIDQTQYLGLYQR